MVPCQSGPRTVRLDPVWKRIAGRLKELAEAWARYECMSLAAGIAFYAALSVFPLMLVMIAGVGSFFRFMERGRDAKAEIHATISQQMSPELADAMMRVFGQMQEGVLVQGPVAGVMLLFGATLVFFQIDRAFYRIWDVRQRPDERGFVGSLRRMLLSRVRSLGLVMGACLLVVVVFVVGIVFRTTMDLGQRWLPDLVLLSSFVSTLISVAINLIVFTVLYRFLSKERVGWVLCVKAGLFASVLLECGDRLLGALSFGANFSAYGLVGSFLIMQIWIYYNAMILLIGALIVRVEARPSPDFRELI